MSDEQGTTVASENQPHKATKPQAKRQQTKNWTQFDYELIVAARDHKDVEIFFDLEAALSGGKEGWVAKPIIIDRYSVKFDFGNNVGQLWIQKVDLVAVRVL